MRNIRLVFVVLSVLTAFGVNAIDVKDRVLLDAMSSEEIAAYKAEEHRKALASAIPQVKALRTQSVAVGMDNATVMAASGAQSLIENVAGSQMEDGTVRITYDLHSSYQCAVTWSISVDDRSLAVARTFLPGSDVGIVKPGTGKKIFWHARADWPNQKSNRVKAILTATETGAPMGWANIKIEWAEWGGTDIDVCGYWTDRTFSKVGWKHGDEDRGTAWQHMWKGDNTQSGPENVMVFIDNAQLGGVLTERIYKIHFNHFGEAAANPHVRVTVTGNGKTLTATVGAATRKSQRAETSDPFVLISFDASNTPIGIR